MENQIYYRPNDEETAIQLERRLGRTSQYARSHTEREEGKVSEGLSEQGVPLLTAQKIMELPDEDVIAFHRNLPPMRLKRMDWRKNVRLSRRHNMKPPALPALPPVTNLTIPNADPLTDDSLIDPDDIQRNRWPISSRWKDTR